MTGELLLQNWTTIRADATTEETSLPQAEAGWLDVGYASDLTLYLEIAQVSGGTLPRIRYETSPNRDASQFREMAFVPLVYSAIPIVTRVALYDAPTVPVARWLRWRLTTNDVSATWDVTFRVTAFLYPR